MPSASELAAVVLNPPLSGPIAHNASQSSAQNQDYDVILGDTLHPFSYQDIQLFRTWLESVPFNFDEISQTTIGRVFESEGDVRLFFEPAVVIACWPILLAMAPTANRNYDLALRSEKTLRDRSRPDISICKLLHGSNGAVYKPIVVVEFKDPGVFSQVCNSGNINTDAGDDWDIVSSQIRKYVICNTMQNVVVMDDKWAVYLYFNNPYDIGAVCNYMVAPTGTSNLSGSLDSSFSMTVRELYLFSVFRGLSAQSQLRRYTNYTSTGVTAAIGTPNFDYVTQFAGVTPSPLHRNNPAVTAASHPPWRSTRVVLSYTRQLVFPRCNITEFDITPPRISGMIDSGFEGLARRSVRQFFVSNDIISGLEMEIGEYKGKAMISPPTDPRRPSTPPITADLVLKHFPPSDLIGAFQEATLYAALNQYQGLILPFCYGVFDIDGIDGIGILLEKVHGPTLAEYLGSTTMGADQIRDLYLDCFHALRCMHNAGYAHRDIKGENIIVASARQIVLMDFENSKPASETSRRLDKAALRVIFRRLGVDERVLRSWAT